MGGEGVYFEGADIQKFSVCHRETFCGLQQACSSVARSFDCQRLSLFVVSFSKKIILLGGGGGGRNLALQLLHTSSPHWSEFKQINVVVSYQRKSLISLPLPRRLKRKISLYYHLFVSLVFNKDCFIF